MKVFVAGGGGVVGRHLIPRLASRGHQVVATTRTADKMADLRAAGAEPIVLDGLDRRAVEHAVRGAKPDVIVHQMTALAGFRSLRRFERELALTNRLRTEGAAHLVAAAQSAGARRFVAQSYTGWPNAREGGRVKTEEDPLDSNPPAAMKPALEAIHTLESTVLTAAGLEGVVLRYGSFYGPGTQLGPGGAMLEAARRRQLPIVGTGAGIWSFVHIDDVALATVMAVEGGPAGIYNVVDDEPAEVSVWLPELARSVGSPPPRRVPAWLAKFLIGEAGVLMMTAIRGSSNAKARTVLGWNPGYPSWRDGFKREFAGVART